MNYSAAQIDVDSPLVQLTLHSLLANMKDPGAALSCNREMSIHNFRAVYRPCGESVKGEGTNDGM